MILVTNDDGIHSPGVRHLAEAMAELDEVVVVCPDRGRSGVGMAITIDQPLRAQEIAPGWFSVDGTPVDCVDLAIGELVPKPPRLVISGINLGQNLGHDVHFSGTIAAARKATFLGFPSVAVSLAWSDTDWHFSTARRVAARVAKEVLARGLPAGVLLNVNVPNRPPEEIRGVRVVRLDPAPYDTHVLKRLDKWGRPYYWIGGKRLDAPNRHETDVGAIEAGYVAITPLHADLTDYPTLQQLSRWNLEWDG